MSVTDYTSHDDPQQHDPLCVEWYSGRVGGIHCVCDLVIRVREQEQMKFASVVLDALQGEPHERD